MMNHPNNRPVEGDPFDDDDPDGEEWALDPSRWNRAGNPPTTPDGPHHEPDAHLEEMYEDRYLDQSWEDMAVGEEW